MHARDTARGTGLPVMLEAPFPQSPPCYMLLEYEVALPHAQIRAKMSIAKLLETRSHIIPGKLKVSELFFEVPLDYSHPSRGAVKIFARSVTRHEKPVARAMEDEPVKKSQKPWFVYLQGGPGMSCRPPQNMPITNLVLDRGYQMLCLDQRGTGLSTPISSATLALQGDSQKQADYLKLFRADSIVQDCEAIRKALTKSYPTELQKWTVFGQSFGGFCALTYLSKFPQGLREVFTSGGIPPVGKSIESVYVATYAKLMERNEAYYRKFPEDVDAVHKLAEHINSKGGLGLPAGGTLTVQRFLTLGVNFGGSGGLDMVHDFVLRMSSDIAQFAFVTRPTLASLEAAFPFDDNVLYAVLHEPIYCEGTASNWAAHRVSQSLKEFRWVSGSQDPAAGVGQQPLYFSGEMIFPFMFETYPELVKLKGVAEILAKDKNWPELYDEAQLARNEVPIYAASFVEDMYVDFGLVQETVKNVKNVKQFITNTMYHDAVRSKTEEVMKGLFDLRDDSID